MLKKGTLIHLLTGLLMLSILLAACQAVEMQEPAQEFVETLAAETLAALDTQTAVAEVAQEGTQIAETQTTQAAIPSDTPMPTPTPTPTQEGMDFCHQASFIADVTVEDRQVFDPGESFTKTWRLMNRGDCTWTTDYQVVFSSGYRMGATRAINLPQVVPPGETVDLSLNMVAPSAPGLYTGYWLLMDSAGETFGTGVQAETPFWVRIRVTEEDEIVVYNLADNACDAGWESSVEKDIDCPSPENIEEGFVQPVENPTLEDGKTYYEPAILTYPDFDRSGYMVGRFPALKIEEGDHFRATIGCQYGAESCNINYTLRVAMTGEGFDRLGQWHKVYDGRAYPIDVDLSDYAGMEVDIVLSVIAADDSTENYALWLDPRVIRDLSPDEPQPCNQASFVEHVTFGDKEVLDPAETFTKIWRLENTGTCTWTKDYHVVFSSGYQMGAPDALAITEPVEPGETIDISIDMVAPSSPGTYTGYWLLMDEEEDYFGIGDAADSPFWVRIRVTEDDEFVVYNLADNVCEAGWESSVQDEIACPSEEDLENGFVQPVDMPRFENGITYDEPAILTYPDFGESGYIVGRYPALTIEDGDHFRATIGCQFGANACNVNYTLRVAIPGEGLDRLGQWHEVYEGLVYPIDVDLSDYAGMEVDLVLSVIGFDDTAENYALWLNPRVVRDAD